MIDQGTIARFEAKVRKTGSCWLWTAGRIDGYGRFRFEGEKRQSHRIAWLIYRGSLESEAQVLHRCDIRHCVNPDHLFLGTNADNIADMYSKGRGPRVIPDEVISDIRKSKSAPRELTERHGVSISYISEIRAWKHRLHPGARRFESGMTE